MPLQRHWLRALGATLLVGAVAACTLNTDIDGPGGLVKYSGDQQTAPVNTQLPTALAVTVVTQFGEPIKGQTVNWTIAAGGGTLSSNVSVSDDAGVAAVTYTTGPTAGAVVIRAQVHGVPPLTFHETVN